MDRHQQHRILSRDADQQGTPDRAVGQVEAERELSGDDGAEAFPVGAGLAQLDGAGRVDQLA